MNRIYRNVWNAATRTWTAVAETARRHSRAGGKSAAVTCIAAGLAALSVSSPAFAALALSDGGLVAAGSGPANSAASSGGNGVHA